MFGLASRQQVHGLESVLAAISKSQAIIEFNMDGTIITANENFLNAVGYTLSEIQGHHHSMFLMPIERDSIPYRQFWASLNRGEYQAAEYKRIGKGGKEIWIQASYNPILDSHGRPYKVVKFATDITDQKLQYADFSGQISAINKSQAVIEFNMDGTIITANENFLKAMGYSLSEIQGQHHSMFVNPVERDSIAYKQFWASLNRGEYQAAEYKRFGKGGKEIWIQASYNPILDPNGKPLKVVKFATDVTKQKLEYADFSGQIAAIGKSQAIIEFNMDGTIITANENFLKAMGYSLSEIQGQHHSMFVDPIERDGQAYKQFWASLNRGEYQAAEYKRFGKGGKEVWIQATYNPIIDLNGKPFKVVKFASEVTKLVNARLNLKTMLQGVAAGAEEMNASIREIAERMVKSKETATTAFDQVTTTDKSTQGLSTASQAMTGVVDLISDIASQINLLALNATIESARAGEAGRGFAVVANEVKNLANQAKNATEKISKEINSMQGISTDVAEGLSVIKQSIEWVREYATSTAAAVEEQSAVVNEMSSSMQRAAAEADNIG